MSITPKCSDIFNTVCVQVIPKRVCMCVQVIQQQRTVCAKTWIICSTALTSPHLLRVSVTEGCAMYSQYTVPHASQLLQGVHCKVNTQYLMRLSYCRVCTVQSVHSTSSVSVTAGCALYSQYTVPQASHDRPHGCFC